MNKTLGKDPKAGPVSRRTLFVGAGTVGALAAAAALLPKTPGAPPVTPAAGPALADGGYQLTEHVLHYYRTARV